MVTLRRMVRRALKPIQVTTILALVFVLPAQVLAAPPIERIMDRHHRTEIVQVVTDDVCGDVAGSQGLRSGTFSLVETGHWFITLTEDGFHVSDVETGTYSYDFDDPAIPDVSGYHYVSPFTAVFTRNDNLIVMENQHEFLPGSPDGIRIWFRYHLTARDDVPIVEREFFKVTGCP